MADPVPDSVRKIRVDTALEAAVRQLEAAIAEQEQAANRILGLVELLSEGAVAPDRTTQLRFDGIMESCGFQDITGQRIMKVVRFLRYLAKELHLSIPAPPSSAPGQPQDKQAGAGLSQEQVDRLLRGEKI